jgi:Adenosine deaminase
MGLPPADLTKSALLTNFDNSAPLIARILRKVPGERFPPNLSDEVSDFLDEYSTNPLSIALIAKSGSGSFLATSSRIAPEVCTEEVFADSHLHSGASADVETMLGIWSGNEKSFPKDLLKVTTTDRIGQPFSIGTVVAAFRVASSYCGSRINRLTPEISPDCLEAIHEGCFWQKIREVSLSGPSARDPEWHMASFVEAILSVAPSSPGTPAEVWSFVENSARSGTPRDREFACGVMACVTLISQFLSSEHHEGLPGFVDRFDAVAKLWQMSVSIDGGQVVSKCLDSVLSSASVVGAEFRKTIICESGVSETEQAIKRALSDHLAGFAHSPLTTHVKRSLTMPVSFVRRPVLKAHRNQFQPLGDLSSSWNLAAAILSLRDSNPVAAEYIRSVDVAGNELLASNWIFVPLLSELRGAGSPPLTVSCHAGESFLWWLQGIRSVGELIMPGTRVVDRIGHALALDKKTATSIVGNRTRRVRRRDAIDDLCWIISSGIDSTKAADLLERVFGEANIDIDVSEICAAWLSRRSVDAVGAAFGGGNLQDQPAWDLGSDTNQLPETMSKNRSVLLLMLLQGPGRYCELDRNLGLELTKHFLDYSEWVGPSASEAVLAEIIKEGVIIEACPTSNRRLAGMEDLRRHPLKRWLELGAQVSVSSDDPTLFDTNVEKEFGQFKFLLTDDQFKDLQKYSVESCGSGLAPQNSAEFFRSFELL